MHVPKGGKLFDKSWMMDSEWIKIRDRKKK
jgi:hypothetical protein